MTQRLNSAINCATCGDTMDVGDHAAANADGKLGHLGCARFASSALVGPAANRPASPADAGDLQERIVAILVHENGGPPPSASGQPAATPSAMTTTVVAEPARATTTARAPAARMTAAEYEAAVVKLLVSEGL